MGLREDVEVMSSATGWIRFISSGVLDVGADGLPELVVTGEKSLSVIRDRPATAPACWSLRVCAGNTPGLLLESWNAIRAMQSAIATAEREAEETHADVA